MPPRHGDQLSMARLRPVMLVHYHELGLKRGNRPLFLRHLARNLRRATGDLGPASLRDRAASLGGTLTIDSEGSGSCVEITLPLTPKRSTVKSSISLSLDS